MTAASLALQKNDGALRPREIFQTSFPTIPFYFERTSEMTAKTAENAAKASVFSREANREKARFFLGRIAGREGYVKDRIRKVHLFLLPALPNLKYSRVKELLGNEERIHVRGEEFEAIKSRYADWVAASRDRAIAHLQTLEAEHEENTRTAADYASERFQRAGVAMGRARQVGAPSTDRRD